MQIPKSIRDKSEMKSPLDSLTEHQQVLFALKVIQAYADAKRDGLELYEPLPCLKRFHASTSRVRMVSGVNQGGKTLGTLCELTRLFRGRDPYKKRASANLRMYSVGKDEQHLADPMMLKIFWPGAFTVVKDEETRLLRSVRVDTRNPNQLDPRDEARKSEWEPSPPLLTEREATIRWNKKGLGVPKIIEHRKNGSRWWWFTSKSDPRQGGEVDVFHCDEEIEKRGGKSWIAEGQARTLKRAGIQVYGFTPQAATPEYFELHKRVLRGETGIEEFHISIEDNPFISAEAKRALFEDLKHDPDELAVRYYGQYAISQRRVFPQYDPNVHRVDDFLVPADWMRVMVIDPGSQYAGILFAAVPPDENEVHCYAELFLRNKTVEEIAAIIAKDYTVNQRFEVFLIDEHAARQRPLNIANKVTDHWVAAFEAANIRSQQTGSHFHFGSDNIDAREMSLKRWMTHSPPILRIHRRSCPYLDRQLQSRHYAKDKPDKRNDREQHDLVDCAGYLAGWFDEYIDHPAHPFGLCYFAPEGYVPLSEEERRNHEIYSVFLKRPAAQRRKDQTFSHGSYYRPTADSFGVR